MESTSITATEPNPADPKPTTESSFAEMDMSTYFGYYWPVEIDDMTETPDDATLVESTNTSTSVNSPERNSSPTTQDLEAMKDTIQALHQAVSLNTTKIDSEAQGFAALSQGMKEGDDHGFKITLESVRTHVEVLKDDLKSERDGKERLQTELEEAHKESAKAKESAKKARNNVELDHSRFVQAEQAKHKEAFEMVEDNLQTKSAEVEDLKDSLKQATEFGDTLQKKHDRICDGINCQQQIDHLQAQILDQEKLEAEYNKTVDQLAQSKTQMAEGARYVKQMQARLGVNEIISRRTAAVLETDDVKATCHDLIHQNVVDLINLKSEKDKLIYDAHRDKLQVKILRECHDQNLAQHRRMVNSANDKFIELNSRIENLKDEKTKLGGEKKCMRKDNRKLQKVNAELQREKQRLVFQNNRLRGAKTNFGFDKVSVQTENANLKQVIRRLVCQEPLSQTHDQLLQSWVRGSPLRNLPDFPRSHRKKTAADGDQYKLNVPVFEIKATQQTIDKSTEKVQELGVENTTQDDDVEVSKLQVEDHPSQIQALHASILSENRREGIVGADLVIDCEKIQETLKEQIIKATSANLNDKSAPDCQQHEFTKPSLVLASLWKSSVNSSNSTVQQPQVHHGGGTSQQSATNVVDEASTKKTNITSGMHLQPNSSNVHDILKQIGEAKGTIKEEDNKITRTNGDSKPIECNPPIKVFGGEAKSSAASQAQAYPPLNGGTFSFAVPATATASTQEVETPKPDDDDFISRTPDSIESSNAMANTPPPKPKLTKAQRREAAKLKAEVERKAKTDAEAEAGAETKVEVDVAAHKQPKVQTAPATSKKAKRNQKKKGRK